jgi:hypothetical protein
MISGSQLILILIKGVRGVGHSSSEMGGSSYIITGLAHIKEIATKI